MSLPALPICRRNCQPTASTATKRCSFITIAFPRRHMGTWYNRTVGSGVCVLDVFLSEKVPNFLSIPEFSMHGIFLLVPTFTIN